MTSGSLFMSWRQSCYINYHASHEKSTQRTDNKRSSMETIIFALQSTPINSKITESLIINLTQNPWKTTWGAYSRGRPPPPLKFGPPPPLWISVTLRGGVGYGYFLELHNAYLAGYRIEGGGGYISWQWSLHTCGKTVRDFRIHTCKTICADHQLIHPAMQAKDMNEPYVENKALCMQMLGDG